MYFVLDIGGTFIKYAVMDENANIVEKGKFPTIVGYDHEPSELTEQIGQLYDRLKAKHDINGIAISMPGMIDVDKGIVYDGGSLTYLDKCAFKDLLSKRCDKLPTAIENDAKCAALAEVWKGNAADCNDAVLFIFGTGVGGAIVLDRKIRRGKNLSAGEFSYLLNQMKRKDIANLDPEELRALSIEDYCDRVPYILSSYASVSALCNQVAHCKRIPFNQVSGEKVYQWIDEGDKAVTEIMEEMYFNIAKQCCNMQIAFDPDVILIGGGISAEPRFIQGITKYADEIKKLTIALNGLKILPCKYLNDSNLIGALYHYKQMTSA